ncbi:MAG TPA: metallopeptidase family protein [Bryobacteraceae bacterium]|nr:metallopeptidase family protein [Bryobacteraceae bacterium]
MRAQDFDALVERCYARIPRRFRERLDNVAIMIEPEASPRQLRAVGVRPGGTLLGLYEGRPLTVRHVSDGFVLPDRITIFQNPLEQMARDERHLEQLVYETLWHEIAHYFGMNERQVRAAEKKRALERLRKRARS